LDNLRRDWLEGGQLADLLHLGVRGITSNPTILAALARNMINPNRALRANPPTAPTSPDVTDVLPCRVDKAEFTSSRHLLCSFT
jgi:transaldolase